MESTGQGKYHFFDHAADVGIEVTAPTLPGLFTTAARALLAWMGPVPAGDDFLEIQVELEEDDIETLLLRWLQEILYLFYQRHAYTTEVSRWEIGNNRLSATLRYRRWDDSRSGDYQEVKAVTYHQLQVLRGAEGWSARMILDL